MSIERLGHHTTNEAARTYLQNADGARAASAANSATDGAAKTTAAPRTDSVSLSDNARSVAAALAAVQQAPDVRDAKVNEIKQRVQDGTYDVPARVLARNMIDASATA
jgi:negative regulator of flagellin synthesis FlgM